MTTPATNWTDQAINATNYQTFGSMKQKAIGEPIGLLLSLTEADTVTIIYPYPNTTYYTDQAINSTNWS